MEKFFGFNSPYFTKLPSITKSCGTSLTNTVKVLFDFLDIIMGAEKINSSDAIVRLIEERKLNGPEILAFAIMQIKEQAQDLLQSKMEVMSINPSLTHDEFKKTILSTTAEEAIKS